MLNSLAVVLEQPERLALTRLPARRAGGRDVVVETQWSGVSTGTERLLFTAACHRSRAWAIRSCRATRPSERWSRPARTPAIESARACSFPAPAASARCADCTAAPPRIWSRRPRASCRFRRARRKGRAARARRDRAPRPRTGRISMTAPYRRPRRPRPPARAPAPRSRAASRPSSGRRTRARRAAPSATTSVARRRRARRLSRHLRRQRRRDDSRSADAAARAGRRDRARRLLRSPELRLPARLHARGADSRRGAMARRRSRRGRRLVESGRLSLDGLITHRRPASEAACRLSRSRSTIRPA